MPIDIGGSVPEQLQLLYNYISTKVGSLSTGQQSALKYSLLATGAAGAGYGLYKFLNKNSEKNAKLAERLRFLLKITVPSFQSKSFLQLVALAFVVVCRTFISNVLSTLSGELSKALLDHDTTEFVRCLGISTTTSVLSAILAPTLNFLIDKSAIEWRSSLTKYMHDEYLHNKMYYKTSSLDNPIENPDSVVTQDVQKWCEGMCGLFANLIKPFADLLLYTTKLVEMTGWIGPISIVSYMITSWMFISVIRPKFNEMTSKVQQLEGDFRYGHVRTTTNGESIAFYGGDDLEKEFAEKTFEKLFQHKMQIESVKRNFEFFNELFVVDLPQSMCWILSAVPVFYGNLSNVPQSILARDLRYLAAVISHEFSALGELVKLTTRFNEMTGYTNNISDLLDKIRQYKGEATKSNIIEGDALKFEGVDLVTPNNVKLLTNINIEMTPGKNYLLTGPNAVGKSSLFRMVQGLWPIKNGTITKPGSSGSDPMQSVYYVTTKPYNCVGTLRDQITYPKQNVDPKDCSEELLTGLLKMVDIEKIIHRYGWNTIANWDDCLSLGEQQRLSMARLFYHRPKYAILDESTSAVSVDIERFLYEHAKEIGVTIITVSLRPALKAYHDYEIKLENGQYSVHSIKNSDEIDD